MSSRHIARHRVERGPWPRPNVTMRELIGLVLAFAISNAFLSWINPVARLVPALFGIWNAALAIYLGFAFLQAWLRSVSRWSRTGSADSPRRRMQRWTALGVAEATVIGGTMLACLLILLNAATRGDVIVRDLGEPVTILLLGSAAGIVLMRMWRTRPGKSLTGRATEPTMEGDSGIGRGETY